MAKQHISLRYDSGIVEEVGANLDLRLPNLEALAAIALKFDQSAGKPFEAVLDMATAVGKTYVAAGIIDYVSALGVRNIVIVTPSRPILNKTVTNFTKGHAKSIRGMATVPLVVTGEDFTSGAVATALADDSVVKLFVFTVQQLIKPKEKASRRVRDFQEGLGQGLYDYLQSVPDLVVIADEHHAYYGPAFSDAIRELDAAGLVGLTATPHTQTPTDSVIYRYPLGRAIADGLVKVPVLVGRKDDRHDTETQLADGVALLKAKRDAVKRWCEHTGAKPVNPVMFIVCQSIEDANEVTEILGRPNFFGVEYDRAVLTVHSDSSDDALEKLDHVEDSDSSVRVIVSVSMLKEGWDVKNIFVICALRALASQVLTEQTLGRGLRLPFGQLTGIEMLDTVEVLGHDRYEELLRRSSILIESLVKERTKPVEVNPTTGVAMLTPDFEATPAQGNLPLSGGEGATTSPVIRVAQTDVRIQETQREAEAMRQVIELGPDVKPFLIPKMTRTLTAAPFSLSQIEDNDFFLVGQSLAATPEETLRRSKIEVTKTASGGLRVTPVPAQDLVAAAPMHLEIGDGQGDLVEAILNSGMVEARQSELNAAIRLVDALAKGLGKDAEARLAGFFNTALGACLNIIRIRYHSTPSVEKIVVTEEYLALARFNIRPVLSNHYGPFSRDEAYSGWTKSLVDIEWFDSSTERDMAILLDEDSNVTRWVRLHRNELVVPWRERSYNPDFAVELRDGSFWLVETKANYDLASPDVLGKKKAAEEWARYATDSDQVSGKWKYLLVGESQLKNARGNWSLIVTQASIQPAFNR